ncbi:MAG: hypothetical protein K9K64_04845 [Desulfohalobiaceae bacterium]|nr:hypothetical protein [Desulfohalobiaceae bacterium]
MTTEKTTLKAGQPLGVTPPFEGYMPVLNRASFDIIAFFSGLTPRDLRDWVKGKIRYGLYVENGIPIFLLDLGKTWSLDVYFNMHQEKEEQRKEFFEGEPGYTKVNLTLVSYTDTIVQGIRSIDVGQEFMMALKEACFDQLSRYANKDDCFLAAETILQSSGSKSLRKKTEMHQL